MILNNDSKKILLFSSLVFVLVLVVGIILYFNGNLRKGDFDKIIYSKDSSYIEKIKTYKEQRIVFGEQCSIEQKELSVKNDTELMLENQSGDDFIIRMLGVSYLIPKHSYILQKASAPKLPANFQIGCPNAKDRIVINLF